MAHADFVKCGDRVLGVDPGSTYSAYCLFDVKKRRVVSYAKDNNDQILKDIAEFKALNMADFLAVEQLKAYGHASDSLFFTAMWTGRIIASWLSIRRNSYDYTLLPRKSIVSLLCGSSRANDSQVRQAVIDYFIRVKAPQGGGRSPIIGTKKSPGHLFKMSGDMWSAAAVALAWSEFTDSDRQDRFLQL
jgi:Holliday junction resolvasome RuvABC endonuclease subunit